MFIVAANSIVSWGLSYIHIFIGCCSVSRSLFVCSSRSSRFVCLVFVSIIFIVSLRCLKPLIRHSFIHFQLWLKLHQHNKQSHVCVCVCVWFRTYTNCVLDLELLHWTIETLQWIQNCYCIPYNAFVFAWFCAASIGSSKRKFRQFAWFTISFIVMNSFICAANLGIRYGILSPNKHNACSFLTICYDQRQICSQVLRRFRQNWDWCSCNYFGGA